MGLILQESAASSKQGSLRRTGSISSTLAVRLTLQDLNLHSLLPQTSWFIFFLFICQGTLADILALQGLNAESLYDAVMANPLCLDMAPKVEVTTPPREGSCKNALNGAVVRLKRTQQHPAPSLPILLPTPPHRTTSVSCSCVEMVSLTSCPPPSLALSCYLLPLGFSCRILGVCCSPQAGTYLSLSPLDVTRSSTKLSSFETN